MKARIRRDPTLSLHAVYEEVVSELPDDAEVPPFASVKSSLYRCRAAQMPAIPANIDNVVIEGVWSHTRDGRRFLRMVDRVAVFASDYCIRQLGQCTQFFMDGTFKSCPRPYRQFFTIHDMYIDRVVPRAFVLTHHRQVGAYRQVLACIKNRYTRLTGRHVQLDLIVTDFEVALRAAVETEFPAAEVREFFTIVVKPFGSMSDSNASVVLLRQRLLATTSSTHGTWSGS
ncbi:hypothetical protein ACOMHN_020613 [Nucella lapillus]